MKFKLLLFNLLFLNVMNFYAQNSFNVSQYNIVWNSPSRDALESMPLSGKFGAGANVWVQDGAVWLYLAHNLANDEDGRLLKLGALRITPSSDVFSNRASFKQELDLTTGAINIDAVSKTGQNLKIKLWFSGETLIIQSKSIKKTSLDIAFGSWRDIERDLFNDLGKRSQTYRADSVWMNSNGIVWEHRNANYPSVLDVEIKVQPFSAGNVYNPAKNNVFGGAIVCNQPLTPIKKSSVNWQEWQGSAWNMTAAAAKSHTIVVALRAKADAASRDWLSEANVFLSPKAIKHAEKNEMNRWDEFWSRSYIAINKGAAVSDSAWIVGRNYQLFRYMLACNQDGKLPLRFNGGIFCFDNYRDRITGNYNDELPINSLGASSPDYRRWMFCHFMAQNQRWLGWPTILAGDADLLQSSSAFYRMHEGLAKVRATGLGAQGVVYPEALKVWGLTWNPTREGLCKSPHLTYAVSMMLENAWMTLHGFTSLGTNIRPDLEWIKGTVRFFDSYYRNETKRLTGNELGEDGKLCIYPANSIEYLIEAKNPIEIVAGLRRVTDALLKLPVDMLSVDEKNYFTNVLAILPELPAGKSNGLAILLPAESFNKEYNFWELPEFYAAWPYRINSVVHPGTTQILQNTWDELPVKRSEKVTRDYSWMPVVVNMAAIGNTKEATRRVIDKLGNFNPQARFPAFFGPGHDWLPDHNWGGTGMVGLQEMLMAANPYGDGKIYLLPAWPANWDVDFKLHAPQQTQIEISVRGGKLLLMKVLPEYRRKDVIVNPAFIVD